MAASAFLCSRRHGRLSFGRCSDGVRDDHPPEKRKVDSSILSLTTTTRLSGEALTSRNVTSDFWLSKQCSARSCPSAPVRGRIAPIDVARSLHDRLDANYGRVPGGEQTVQPSTYVDGRLWQPLCA
jgi:hypothetical protein